MLKELRLFLFIVTLFTVNILFSFNNTLLRNINSQDEDNHNFSCGPALASYFNYPEDIPIVTEESDIKSSLEVRPLQRGTTSKHETRKRNIASSCGLIRIRGPDFGLIFYCLPPIHTSIYVTGGSRVSETLVNSIQEIWISRLHTAICVEPKFWALVLFPLEIEKSIS